MPGDFSFELFRPIPQLRGRAERLSALEIREREAPSRRDRAKRGKRFFDGFLFFFVLLHPLFRMLPFLFTEAFLLGFCRPARHWRESDDHPRAVCRQRFHLAQLLPTPKSVMRNARVKQSRGLGG